MLIKISRNCGQSVCGADCTVGVGIVVDCGCVCGGVPTNVGVIATFRRGGRAISGIGAGAGVVNDAVAGAAGTGCDVVGGWLVTVCVVVGAVLETCRIGRRILRKRGRISRYSPNIATITAIIIEM